jgi:hypothetical protein
LVPEVAGALTLLLADANVPGVIAVLPSSAVISNPKAEEPFGSDVVMVIVCAVPGV